MPVTVRWVGPLRRWADGERSLQAEVRTVGEALSALEARHPRLARTVRGPRGGLGRRSAVLVQGRDVRLGLGLETPLADGDEVVIVPTVGGARPVVGPCGSRPHQV